MTDRYVGIGGSDGNSGLTWALRKLTLTGAEDTPVVAGDTIYVGPGVYRETLTCDVDGSSGNPITYIGDIIGVNTDGIGGEVVITGSDDDQTHTRSTCISIPSSRIYRTFTGFHIRGGSSYGIYCGGDNDNCIISDCAFADVMDNNAAIYINVTSTPSYDGFVVERCFFLACYAAFAFRSPTTVRALTDFQILNCITIACGMPLWSGLFADSGYVTGWVARNCFFHGGRLEFGNAAANNYIYNSFILAGSFGTTAGSAYLRTSYCFINVIFPSGWNPGTGDITDTTVLADMSLPLIPGSNFPVKFPQMPLAELNQWADLARETSSSPTSEDFYGISKPATNSKISIGAIQAQDRDRELTTVRTGKISVRVDDASRIQYYLPVDASSTTISVYVYRESNYAGTNPQMIIREYGQSPRTTTDASSAAQWNQLTDTFTPQSGTQYVIVELVSNNTATSGSFATYFDDLEKVIA